NLAEGFEALGQSDSALVYYHRQAALKDSLFSEAKNRQIVEMQEKFESVQKDRSIAELERKREQQAAKIRARNLLLVATGIIALVVLLLGVSYYQKLQAEKALAAQNKELNRNRMMELVKDNELKSLHAFMEGETAERQRIIGALHDGLGSRLATAKLHFDHLAAQGLSGDQHQQLELANGLLGETLVDLRELAHNLAAGVLNEFGLVPALRELSASISATGQLAVQLDAFELEGRLPPALEISLYRSVQELLSNTIRHAQATETSIQLVRHEDHLSLLVADNGKGFDPEAMRASSGIGIAGISKRITALGGNVSIDSQPGHGVTAVLEVPLPDPLNTAEL
ncbi:MAG: sensor histidine kinase, partial [Bacteroidota bacterium]